jgi:phenylacetate-coenzyme A ligase PaaK-like adenylate-forming protein
MIGFPHSFAGSSQTMGFCSRFWLARKIVDYRPVSIEQPFPEVVRQLNEFQPHIVSGYAKLLLLLADAQRSGTLKIAPDSIDSGGEQLLETDRRYLKDTFRCEVNNHYGSTEGFSMGICRDGDNAIELFEDHLIFKINPGDTHITTLQSFTMPLIRYEMRDILVPRPLSEARPFQRVEPLIGRSDEIPYFTTEDHGEVTVHPLAFDPLMPEGVKSFSMSSPGPNQVRFHIFIDQKKAAEALQILAQVRSVLTEFFAAKNLPKLAIEVVEENSYNLNPLSGKSQFWRRDVVKSKA